MTLIICADKKGNHILCDDCDENLLKDPFCLGDYSTEGVLLKFCVKCGRMDDIRIDPKFIVDGVISNSLKKRIGKRLAKVNGLDYKKMNIIIKDLRKINGADDFAFLLSAKINEEFDVETEKNDIVKFI